MAFARNDQASYPGMDQDTYMLAANFSKRTIGDLLEEFSGLRQANIALFRSFDAAALQRKGTASGAEMSVKALVYCTAGHVEHHIKILNERYVAVL